MLSVKGIYENGYIKLDEQVPAQGEVPVIVTFLENLEKMEPKKIKPGDFSFNRSRELLKDFKGLLSDAVIEERRSFL